MASSSTVPPKSSRLLQLHNSRQILLFIVNLIEAVSISEHAVKIDRNTVNGELERTWEKAAAA
jgi:hypothetical protein